MRYETYKPEFENLEQEAAQFGLTVAQMIHGMDSYIRQARGKRWDQTLDCQLFVTENDWIDSGRHIVFINSKDTVKKLLSLRFKASQAVNFSFPWHTFSLAIPKGTVVDGILIKPAFVHYGDHEENIDLSIKYYNKYGIKHIAKGVCYPWETKLKIAVPDDPKNKNCAKSVINLSDDMVVQLLQLKDYNDSQILRKIIGKVDTSNTPLTDLEVKQEVITLRLLLAMSVYNQITEGEFLRSGVPTGLAANPKKLDLDKTNFKAARKHTFDMSKDKRSVSEFVRAGHYRQLTDERFYRGEHENKPRGSRWVKVKPALVNGGSPSTQTFAGK